MTDKIYCMSSFLELRYVEDPEKHFFDNVIHLNYHRIPDSVKTLVSSAEETDIAISNTFKTIRNERLGLLLSGGMDSAILAAYMSGCDAYTFRFQNGNYQADELKRAETYASLYGINLHYIDIDWNIVEECVDRLMIHKGQPVHSIEPQVYYAAKQAQKDGITLMVIGDGSDYVFGGMDKLYSKDWSYDGFVNRYIYVNPADVLTEYKSMNYLFERYRIGPNSIDFLRLLNEITIDESYFSYENAFETAQLAYIDPYASLKMSTPLNVDRIRHGESKYIARDLFKLKYPSLPIPEKLPMPRPVDNYFKNWEGPKRPEFKSELNMSVFNGNQKWLIYILERYLNLFDK